MKKAALSLAGLLAVAAFAPEASAVPVFARQTGMACNACHFQHYPLLNAFGRSFKASGFTLMGAQARVEGDHLSLPAVVNAAVLTSMGYEKSNASATAGVPAGTLPGAKVNGFGAMTGGFFVAGYGGEASLFLGGRGADNMGFLTEIALGDGAAAADSFKTPILTDVGGGFRTGIVPFTTNGQGASYGFEYLNTGANAVHSITNTVGFLNQYIDAVSAAQYLGTGAQATGFSVVAVGNSGFFNFTKFNQQGPDGLATNFASVYGLHSTYARLVWTGDIGGWDTAFGIQNWSGASAFVDPAQGVPATIQQTRATVVDGQMQGSLGGLPFGLYASYGRAPRSTAALVNSFNNGSLERSSFNISAELGVIPETATIGGAIRLANSGMPDVNGANARDNALFLTATYKMAQNLLARLSYVQQSGSYWTTANKNAFGSNSWTLNLYALY